MSNKSSWWKVAAIAAGIVGAVVAVTAFIRSKSKLLNENLDFDNALYFDDDDDMMEDGYFDSEDEMEKPVAESEKTDCDNDCEETQAEE